MKSFGKVIDVDLTGGDIRTSDFTETMAKEYLGGFGWNMALLYREVPQGTDSLGPDNVLVLSPGLLTGTAVPCSSRLHICARSPQSGLMGSSNVGGFFGARMYAAGIRSVIVRGASPRPKRLHLSADGARLLDADDLWGLDTRETEARLKKYHGDPKLETLVIGVAGENQIPFACIMAGPDHAAGRNGMGAVMGAKGLKAITVETIKNDEKPSEAVRALIKEYIQSIRENTARYDGFSTFGGAGDIVELNEMGLLGTRNYRETQLDDAAAIDGHQLHAYVVKRTSCHKCPVHCKAVIEIKQGVHKGFRGGRPEYETVINMGSLCGLTDPDELLYLSNLCNILGMDTISTGSVIAFAMDLFDRGILTTGDTDGLSLNWGDAQAMETLMFRMARRKGIGDVLARGVRQAAEIIGKGAEQYAYHVKGVEIYGGDPRGLMGTALSYAVSLRGGDFTSVYPVPEFRYTPERAKKEFGSEKAVEYTATEGKGAMVRFCMIVSAVVDSLGLCKVAALSVGAHFDLERESALIAALTGLELTPTDLFRIGERIIHMEKLFNIRHGATSEMDMLPDKFTKDPLTQGPAAGFCVDLKPMVADFYRCMGWDEAGVPKAETLKAIGLTSNESCPSLES